MAFNKKILIKFSSVLLVLIILFSIFYGADDPGSPSNDLSHALSTNSSIAINNPIYPKRPTVGLHTIIKCYPVEKSISSIYIDPNVQNQTDVEYLNIENIVNKKRDMVFIACVCGACIYVAIALSGVKSIYT